MMQSAAQKSKQMFCRNPKRASLLVGFIGLTIILFGRMVLNGPAPAPASLIHQTMPGELPITRDQSSSALLDWLAQPKRLPQRNLFGSKLDFDVDQPIAQPSNLELQTTIMEDPPRAMVNGQLVQEGDIVDGFTILKIQPRKLVVQQNGPAVEIDMPRN